MTSIGLFYGSSKGNTETAAQRIKRELGKAAQDATISMINVNEADLSTLGDYDKIILGTSTWENGQLQEDWLKVFRQMDTMDLSGKQVAVFGMGDQYEFADTFQNALGTLARKARERGAELVGLWPDEDYDYTASEGVEDGHFLGLALDITNQYDETRPRIKAWSKQIAGEFGLS